MDTNRIFKITFWSFIKPGIWPFIIICLAIGLFVPFILLTLTKEQSIPVLCVSILVIGYTLIPPAFLHIQYFFKGKDTSIIINERNNTIDISIQDVSITKQFGEIELIEKYHSNVVKGKVFSRAHWFTYYYYLIYFKDREPVCINCMVIQKLEKKIEGANFDSIWKSFPWMRCK